MRNGEQAIRFLRRQDPYAAAVRPALIMLDLNLPAMSGIEVLAEIKSDESLRRISVIVHRILFANVYLKKPSDLATFTQMMEGLEEFWLGTVRLASMQ